MNFKLQAYLSSYKVIVKIFKKEECNKNICDALVDLVPLVQFKKCEKHTWSSVTFSCRMKLLKGGC